MGSLSWFYKFAVFFCGAALKAKHYLHGMFFWLLSQTFRPFLSAGGSGGYMTSCRHLEMYESRSQFPLRLIMQPYRKVYICPCRKGNAITVTCSKWENGGSGVRGWLNHVLDILEQIVILLGRIIRRTPTPRWWGGVHSQQVVGYVSGLRRRTRATGCPSHLSPGIYRMLLSLLPLSTVHISPSSEGGEEKKKRKRKWVKALWALRRHNCLSHWIIATLARDGLSPRVFLFFFFKLFQQLFIWSCLVPN